MTKKQNVCIVTFPGADIQLVADFVKLVNKTDFEKTHDIIMIVSNVTVEAINLKDLQKLIKEKL